MWGLFSKIDLWWRHMMHMEFEKEFIQPRQHCRISSDNQRECQTRKVINIY